MASQQQHMHSHNGGPAHGPHAPHQQEVAQGPPAPTPEALAVADFLKKQDLKSRTCILQGQRKELFRVKRALRALRSPEYEAARKKNPLLPAVTNEQESAIAFSLLPRSLLALRVQKIEPEGGESKKRVKGLWTVQVVPQQEIRDDLHYAWFYEKRTWMQTIQAVGVVVVLLGLVMFPLWPPKMRLGVWYLSVGMLGVIGLFILMSIFRLILFVITMFAAPPGLWLYPNLFEDVGFFDSFRPVWAWHKVKGKKKRKADGDAPAAAIGEKPAASTTATAPPPSSTVTKVARPRVTVEDAED